MAKLEVVNACEVCGATIPRDAAAFVRDDKVLCGPCYSASRKAVNDPRATSTNVADAQLEKCANCLQPIGTLEQAQTWNGNRVCFACFARLKGGSQAARQAQSQQGRTTILTYILRAIFAILMAVPGGLIVLGISTGSALDMLSACILYGSFALFVGCFLLTFVKRAF